MFAVLATLLRFASRWSRLLPVTVALLGSATLLLIWGQIPPPPGTVAAAATANPSNNAAPDTVAPAAPPLSTVVWGPVSNFNMPDFDNIAPAVHPTDPLRALVGGPRPEPPNRYTTDGGTSWQTASGPGLDGLYGGVPAWVPLGNG